MVVVLIIEALLLPQMEEEGLTKVSAKDPENQEEEEIIPVLLNVLNAVAVNAAVAANAQGLKGARET